jgi:choline transport protein
LIFNNETYTPHPWHGTLFVIMIAFVAIGFNTILAKKLPYLEGFLVVIHLLGFLVVIPLWAMAPHRKGGAVLTEYFNGGGWSSVGLSTMVSAY